MPRKLVPPFRRIPPPSRNHVDARWLVRVQCVLLTEGRPRGPQRGNIVRTLTVRGAKVSEVIAAIQTLMEEDRGKS